jgi:hypothetical protein
MSRVALTNGYALAGQGQQPFGFGAEVKRQQYFKSTEQEVWSAFRCFHPSRAVRQESRAFFAQPGAGLWRNR